MLRLALTRTRLDPARVRTATELGPRTPVHANAWRARPMPADCPLRHGPGELLEHRQVENPVVLPRRQCHSDQWFAVAVIGVRDIADTHFARPLRSQRVPQAPSAAREISTAER